MCTNKLPFDNEDEIKNKPTPKLPNEFSDMNDLLARYIVQVFTLWHVSFLNILLRMLDKTIANRLDINQVEGVFSKETQKLKIKREEVSKPIVLSSRNIFEGKNLNINEILKKFIF